MSETAIEEDDVMQEVTPVEPIKEITFIDLMMMASAMMFNLRRWWKAASKDGVIDLNEINQLGDIFAASAKQALGHDFEVKLTPKLKAPAEPEAE